MDLLFNYTISVLYKSSLFRQLFLKYKPEKTLSNKYIRNYNNQNRRIAGKFILKMSIIAFINEYVTSPALVLFMVLSGSYFTFKQKLYSPKKLFFIFGELKHGGREDGISPLSSLSVALAGTLGVGNITGVAVAISVGGAGAVFWMILSSLLGAALKYREAYLTVKTRNKETREGGAPYYIEKTGGRRAGCVYAVLCIIMSVISGSFVQMNAAASSLSLTYGVPTLLSGAVFAVLCVIIVIGGSRRVSAFTSSAMPLFCAVFAALSVVAISMKINEVPAVIARIFGEAFGFSQAAGGFSGAVIAAGIREGMTKGVFSHEAGCGTSSFSHAASSLESPSAQGVIGVLEVLTDTLFFGGLTALVILLSPAGKAYGGYDGAARSISAYSYFFGGAAEHILTVLTVFFAFATVLCWAYYGCCCIRFIFKNEKYVKLYLVLYCLSTAAGSIVSASVIWQISDILCALLLAVNCVCLFKGRQYLYG